MAKILTEYDYSNSIVLADSYRGIDTYRVNGIKILGYLASSDGNWYIDAGDRRDLIDASLTLGSNTLLGGNGNDTIYGGWGNDSINGGADSDIIQAGPGNDTVIYDPADLYVSGGSGVDTIDASSVASVRGKGVTIELNSTRDAYVDFENIIGSAFADTLRGDDGANYITGGAGIDKMYGGGGDDSFIIAAASHHAAGEIIDGGAGYDVIRFISTTEGDTLTLSAKVNVEEARIGDSAGSSSGVTEANIDASYVASTVGIALYGNDGNNHLTGNGAANRIQGGAGDDVIDGGSGDDELTGAGGSDTFVLSAGHDTITDFNHQPPEPEKLIDFELEGVQGIPPIPDVYAGLYWTNAYAFDTSMSSSGGYTEVLNSGKFTAFDLNGGGLSFSDPTSDFDFKSGYFAAGYNWGLEVTFRAWDDGVQVGEATFYLNPQKTFIDFTQAGEVTGRFISIDTISIVGSGGLSGYTTSVAMDDLTLSYGAGEVDLIDVADDMDIDALMASAVSDGMGNTTLYHAGGSVTLVGVDPAAVSADWFV